jgi:hypothetical protein
VLADTDIHDPREAAQVVIDRFKGDA